MNKKAQKYCAKCRAVHGSDCPQAKAWKRSKPNKRKIKTGSTWWKRTRERIFMRDNYLCQLHLKRGLYRAVELHGVNHGVCDHVVPVVEGGTDEDENLQTICQECDKEKTQAEARRARGCKDQ